MGCCAQGFGQNYLWQVELGPSEWVLSDVCNFHIYGGPPGTAEASILKERMDVESILGQVKNKYQQAGVAAAPPLHLPTVIGAQVMERDEGGIAAS